MPIKLKVDLHVHSAEDVAEIVAGRKNMIPAREFIDLALAQQFDAISFTHHAVLFNDPAVQRYAKNRGLLLIPGVETYIERKHVLLINYTHRKHILTYEDLKKHKNEHMLVIAPHPYYLAKICLGKDLEKHIEYFDAIEFSHFYCRLFNLNRKAIRIARKYNLPLVGNSDTHVRKQFGTTYSYVYSEEKTIPAIISAIRRGEVEYVSRLLTLREFGEEIAWIFEKLPYELQMRFRKILKRTSRRVIKRVNAMLYPR